MIKKERNIKLSTRYINIVTFGMWIYLFIMLCLDKVNNLKIVCGGSILMVLLYLFVIIIQPIPKKDGE